MPKLPKMYVITVYSKFLLMQLTAHAVYLGGEVQPSPISGRFIGRGSIPPLLTFSFSTRQGRKERFNLPRTAVVAVAHGDDKQQTMTTAMGLRAYPQNSTFSCLTPLLTFSLFLWEKVRHPSSRVLLFSPIRKGTLPLLCSCLFLGWRGSTPPVCI